MKKKQEELKIEITISGLSAKGLSVKIDAPQKDKQSNGGYFCRITSSAGMDFRLDVYGTIPQDAVRFALQAASARIAATINEHITDTWIE